MIWDVWYLNPRCGGTFTWGNGKMFYVYSNDSKNHLDAKVEGRPIKDGEFQTACSNACSNGAIVLETSTIKIASGCVERRR